MTYATIVADPPWQVKRLSTAGRTFATTPESRKSIAPPYATMPIGDICALPVRDLAARDAHLYLWTINAHVENAYTVARAWGFKPTTLLTWVKTPMGLGPGGAYCNTTEHVLFCRRGRDIRSRRSDSTWWHWKRPYRRGFPGHSEKPVGFQELVEGVSPGPYLEMFARTTRPGWDAWGDEVESDVEIAA